MHEPNINPQNLDKPQMPKGSCEATIMDGPIKKTSLFAVASLVSAIFAIAILFLPLMSLGFRFGVALYSSIAAIILATIAFVVIAFRRKKLKGQGYAFAAITISFLYIFVGMGSVARFMDYRGKYNLHRLGEAIKEYSKDHNGYLPVTNQWCDLLLEHDKSLSRNNFKHPLAEDWPCNFAFNKNVDGLRLADLPNDVVLLFEANGDWNLTGGAELLKQDNFDETCILLVSGNIYSFYSSDGGIEKWNEDANQMYIEPLRWEP